MRRLAFLVFALLCFVTEGFAFVVSSEEAFYGLSSSKNDRKSAADTLRILGVGNSWTRDSMRWLSAIARSAGRPVIVGHAYLGGSTLRDQFFGIDDPSYTYNHGGRKQVVHSTYQYWKYVCADNPVKTPNEGYKNGLGGIGVTLESVVRDEPWDVIVFQPEGTNGSGPLFDAYLGKAGKDFSLRKLKDRMLRMMDKSVARKVRVGLMVPFGYPRGNADYRASLPVNYGVPKPSDQDGWDALYALQHETIQHNMPLLAKSLGASIYVNVGQAVWAARQHPELSKSGFRLQRSRANTHLSEGLAMYVASLAYAFAILDLKPEGITFYPSRTADPLLTGDRGETEEIKLQNTPELAREAIRVVYDALKNRNN